MLDHKAHEVVCLGARIGSSGADLCSSPSAQLVAALDGGSWSLGPAAQPPPGQRPSDRLHVWERSAASRTGGGVAAPAAPVTPQAPSLMQPQGIGPGLGAAARRGSSRDASVARPRAAAVWVPSHAVPGQARAGEGSSCAAPGFCSEQDGSREEAEDMDGVDTSSASSSDKRRLTPQR